MYIKGIGLGFVLYAVFVFINTVAIVRGLTRAAGPNNGEVGIDLVTLYHNELHNPWLIVALFGCLLVGVAMVASWPRFTPVP